MNLIIRSIKAFNLKEKVFALFFLTVFLVSCSLLVLSLIPASDITNTPTEGGIYNEGLVGRIQVLNPLFVDYNNIDRDICRLIFSGLTKYDPLSKDFVADLATYTLSDDKKKYTFTLRDGVKWHDGELLTIDDILFTYKDVIQSDDFSNKVLRSNFAGIEIIKENERQISFTLNDPNRYFITNTIVGILPKHIFKDVPVADIPNSNLNMSPIGSGPYMVAGPPDNGEEETVLSLKRFDDYYGEKSNFEQIRIKIYPYLDLLIKNLSHLHGIVKLAESDLSQIKGLDRFELMKYSLPQYNAVFFNFDSSFMKYKNMRVAAMKAIDKDLILKEITGKSPIDNPLLDLDQSEWYFNSKPDEAKGALYGLGWRLNEDDPEDKVRKNSEGEKLVLRLITQELTTGSKAQIEQEKLIKILKDQWLEAGIDVRDEYYILPELEEMIKQRNYDMLLTGLNMGYNLDIYAYWHSSQAKESGSNFSNFRSFEADAIIENLRQNFENGENREAQLEKLRKVIADDFPGVFLYTPNYYFAADKKIKGINIKNIIFPADRFTYFDKWHFGK